MDQTINQSTNISDESKEVVFTGVEGGQDWTICCWDLKSRTVKTSFKGTSSKAHTLCVFSGEYIISADACKPLIHIWPLNRRDHCLRMKSPGLVTALAVTPDGIYCAAATSYKIFIWLISTGELLSVFHSDQVNNLQFTRNSKFLVSGGGIYVSVWSFTRVLTIARTEDKCIEPVCKFIHGNSVTGLKCGSTAVVTSADRTVNLWSLRNDDLLWRVILDSLVSAIEWSVKEEYIYAGTYDGDIYEIDMANEKKKPTKFIHFRRVKIVAPNVVRKKDRRVTCLSLSTDGQTLVAGSLKGKVFLWNTSTRHLITSLCLNVNSLVTSCFVTYLPPTLEKPVHPIARFQEGLTEEGEGKVKFLLDKQKHSDLHLNLEFGDDKFEKFVSVGLSLLDEFGKVPNKSEQYARNWIRLTEQILLGLHDSLDEIYSSVGSGSAKYKRPPPGQVKLQPCPKGKVTPLSLLCERFENLSAVLSILLCGCGLEFRVVVDFPLRYVIDLLCRTQSVTPPQLLKKPTPERINLAEVVHRLHIAALGILQNLMISVKSYLLPYAEVVNELLLIGCIAWSEMNSSSETKKRQAVSRLRSKAYSAIETSLLYGLSGDVRAFELFFLTVITEAVADAKCLVKTKDQKQVTKAEQALKRANSYWLQVAKNKLKSKQKKAVLSKETAANSTDKPIDEEESLAIQELNISALRVLRRLIGSEGKFLPGSFVKMITDLLRFLYPRIDASGNYGNAFHELVRSVVMASASFPFPIELPVELLMPGLHNDDAEELRQFFVSSLPGGLRTKSLESKGKLVRIIPLTSEWNPESDLESEPKSESASELEIVAVNPGSLSTKRKHSDNLSPGTSSNTVEPAEESSVKRKKLETTDNISSEVAEPRETEVVTEEPTDAEPVRSSEDEENDEETNVQSDEEIVKEASEMDAQNSSEDSRKEDTSSPNDESAMNADEAAAANTSLQSDLESENDDDTDSDDVKEIMKSFVCVGPDQR